MIVLLSRWLCIAALMCVVMSGLIFVIYIMKFAVESIKSNMVIFPLLYMTIMSLKIGICTGLIITIGSWIKWRFKIK